MDKWSKGESELRKVGYLALIEQYQLAVVQNWHLSFVAAGGQRAVLTDSGVEEVYALKYWPGDAVGDQLEFALKYDGTNLAILAAFFEKVDRQQILNYVKQTPTGKYARRIWYLFEFLTGILLPIDDLQQGNYIDLLDATEYYTVIPGRRAPRQRVNVNLLGDRSFCPVVRRTEILSKHEAANLPERCQKILAAYTADQLKRALSYLYTKETKSSFEIEHIAPSSTRTERFVALLQLAEKQDFCRKPQLIELQNRIVDSRFLDSDYRSDQNYIGETVAWQSERIHFVCPKPEDLAALMQGLIFSHNQMDASNVSSVIHAAVIAYGFVFLHPFNDGNGRIHRFLIHNILARRNFTPRGIMFPVSAAMLKNIVDYDASLEAFSRQLMRLVEYSLAEDGTMTVHNETANWYRYMDLTAQVEALFGFIRQTIDSELTQELAFLANYDQTKRAIKEAVDLPDRQIDFFIRLCLQNNGRLSTRKRQSHFAFLSDDEVQLLEQEVQTGYGLAVKTPKSGLEPQTGKRDTKS